LEPGINGAIRGSNGIVEAGAPKSKLYGSLFARSGLIAQHTEQWNADMSISYQSFMVCPSRSGSSNVGKSAEFICEGDVFDVTGPEAAASDSIAVCVGFCIDEWNASWASACSVEKSGLARIRGASCNSAKFKLVAHSSGHLLSLNIVINPTLKALAWNDSGSDM
jgi:hypothetical protein